MKRYFTKQINEYKRELENKALKKRLYSFIIAITVGLFGVLGWWPFLQVIIMKNQTLEELSVLNSNLHTKKALLQNLQLDIDNNRDVLDSLMVSIPSKPEVESYLISFVNAISSAGFTQTTFTASPGEPGEFILYVNLEGSKYFLYSLIESIESLERFTSIQSMRYYFREDSAYVSLVLKIFYVNS